MRTRKIVYICDHCGAEALEKTKLWWTGDIYKNPPEGWAILGREHLCPTCAETYRRLKKEVIYEETTNEKRM